MKNEDGKFYHICSRSKKNQEEIKYLREKNKILESKSQEKQNTLKITKIDKIFLSTLIEKITITNDKKINIYYRIHCNF